MRCLGFGLLGSWFMQFAIQIFINLMLSMGATGISNTPGTFCREWLMNPWERPYMASAPFVATYIIFDTETDFPWSIPSKH